MSRKIKFALGEYYHVFNRGVDKRSIFEELEDSDRFFQSMIEFNTEKPIGSLYEHAFKIKKKIRKKTTKDNKLVSFLAYCLNPNHYHFVLRPLVEGGIERFMQRLGTGYTNYFNEKNKRNGVLFQGKYKASHISTNEYLLHVSAYVNLNFKVHQLGSSTPKLITRSSWGEYVGEYEKTREDETNRRNERDFCDKDIILEQFKSNIQYKKFALDSLEDILKRKREVKELELLLID